MGCREGCSFCCYVDLHVFPSEAGNVLRWFLDLQLEQQQQLVQKLGHSHSTEPVEGTDAAGNLRTRCVFLAEGSCAVYDARPVICRSQGAPLLLEEREDHCPLNFTKGEVPPKSQWLNLNRLTTLQAIAEQNFQRGFLMQTEGHFAMWFNEAVTNEGRIPLRSVFCAMRKISEGWEFSLG